MSEATNKAGVRKEAPCAVKDEMPSGIKSEDHGIIVENDQSGLSRRRLSMHEYRAQVSISGESSFHANTLIVHQVGVQ